MHFLRTKAIDSSLGVVADRTRLVFPRCEVPPDKVVADTMTWLLYAIICALSEGLKDITSKHSLRSLDALTLTWAFFIVTSVLSTPLLLLEATPVLGPAFLGWLFTHATLFGISVFLYMKAISLSQLSLTVPLVMCTPIFMLITAPIGLGEWPTRVGVLGTVLIVVGSYLLNIKDIRQGALAPFRALLSEPGARLMLLVAFIWSITSVIDKLGIKNSSPIFWGISLYWLISLAMSGVLLLRWARSRNDSELIAEGAGTQLLRANWRILLAVGFFNSVQLVTYVLAMSTGLAVYVLAIKRCSVLMVVVLGAVLFGESRVRERLFAVVIMLLGVFCIALG